MTIDGFFIKYNWRAIDWDKVYGGQCVDLFRQYVDDVLGVPQPPAVGNLGAKELWNNYNPQYFERIINGLFDIPKKGDIPIWNEKAGGGFGHVSVVESGNILTFKSFDENWPLGSYCHFVTHNYTNVYGWLRPKVTPPPPVVIGDDTIISEIAGVVNSNASPKDRIDQNISILRKYKKI